MILEDETFNEFDYYAYDLKSQSNKRVIAKCDVCGIIREVTKSAYRGLCPSCAQIKPIGTYPIEIGMLETETYDKFGYYPSQLSLGSNRRILVKCTKCDSIREISRKNHRSMCHSCVRIGKKASEETKLLLSKMRKGRVSPMKGKHLTEEHKQKQSLALKGKYCGEKSPNWKGGISFEPYCIKFNDEFRERAREFFGRRCFECNKTEKENGKRLSVHHVNYDKETCCNDSIPLFVPLCMKCHNITNENREYWKVHFTNRIMEELNGKCYFTKEEKCK